MSDQPKPKPSPKEDPQTKPALASKTLLTVVAIVLISRFLSPEIAAQIDAFFKDLQERNIPIRQADVLCAIFVWLRFVTKDRVDPRYWVDWDAVLKKLKP